MSGREISVPPSFCSVSGTGTRMQLIRMMLRSKEGEAHEVADKSFREAQLGDSAHIARCDSGSLGLHGIEGNLTTCNQRRYFRSDGCVAWSEPAGRCSQKKTQHRVGVCRAPFASQRRNTPGSQPSASSKTVESMKASPMEEHISAVMARRAPA